MIPSARLLIDAEPLSGAWNMAVDAVLLESALARGRATLRWYRWEEPTLSLGHFQRADDPAIEEHFAGVPRVRRLSGGGAILHDQEWTYSLALGPGHPWSARPSQLYRVIHEAVGNVLGRFAIPARPRGLAETDRDNRFLCFSRGDAHDLLIGPHKVLGSAQRRRRGAVLQHGALLLRASPWAPEFPGLLDLASGPVDEPGLFAELTRAVREAVAITALECPLDRSEVIRAAELAKRHAV